MVERGSETAREGSCLLPKQVEREFKNMHNGCFWRQTAMICVKWLCLSNEKGKHTLLHSFAF